MSHPSDPRDDALCRFLIARQLARQAGDLIWSMRYQVSVGSSLSVDAKSGSSDLVTSADHQSQELIFETLSRAYPNHRLIGEEDAQSHGILDARPTWIVDAIDGTTNYVHGISEFAVSIAFAIDFVVEIGVVYNPAKGEMFSAVRGTGAFLNDKPIHVSSCLELSSALILSEWGYVRSRPDSEIMLAANERLLANNCRGVRQLGSGSLDMCYVAMGRADAVYCGVAPEHADAWKIWDYAAASVIAEEAGAILRTIEGEKFDIWGQSMVCTTPGILTEVLKAVNAG